MNSNSFLENRVTRGFGIFMIFIYAGLGILMLFFVDWHEVLPKTNRLVIGAALLLYAAFRTYMLLRFRAQMKHRNTDENR